MCVLVCVCFFKFGFKKNRLSVQNFIYIKCSELSSKENIYSPTGRSKKKSLHLFKLLYGYIKAMSPELLNNGLIIFCHTLSQMIEKRTLATSRYLFNIKPFVMMHLCRL